MKSYELKPTEENIFKTFNDDMFDRNKEVFKFAEMLNSIENNFSIAIDADWGSGKTFFVKQTMMFLNAQNPNSMFSKSEFGKQIVDKWKLEKNKSDISFDSHVCVYYDAWENDGDDDPMLSIVFSILNNTEAYFENTDDMKNILLVAANILSFFTNRDYGKLITQKSDNLQSIRENKKIETNINDFFERLLEEKGNRLVIFIDELDRCKPSYAVKLLERIKHYFTNDRITFVFSVNTKELQHTIRRFYGNNFDANRYLERFFDLRLSLPKVDMHKVFETMDMNDIDENYYTFDRMCLNVINHYNFSIREAMKFIQCVETAAYELSHHSNRYFPWSNENALKLCIIYILPIMMGLKIHNNDDYNGFIQGERSDILLEFSEYIDGDFYADLYANNEYPPALQNKDNKAKLKKIYDAIFGTKNGNEETVSGKLKFNSFIKTKLEKIMGML